MVAQLLHRRAQLRALDFAKFFQRSQGLLKTLAVGLDHGLKGLAILFARGGQIHAHVSLGVTSFQEMLAGRQTFGQIVPEVFQLPAQKSVIEDKTTVVFEDAERLSCPVGGGIRNPSQIHAFIADRFSVHAAISSLARRASKG